MKKTNYMMFCTQCSAPKKIPRYVIENYFNEQAVKVVYCDDCGNATEIPTCLKQLTRELGECM